MSRQQWSFVEPPSPETAVGLAAATRLIYLAPIRLNGFTLEFGLRRVVEIRGTGMGERVERVSERCRVYRMSLSLSRLSEREIIN